MIVYTGINLDNRASILRTFSSYERAEKWLVKLVKEKSSPESDVKDRDITNWVADNWLMDIVSWEDLKYDPSIHGDWDSQSLWAMVNHDFSKLTRQRWKNLKKSINFVSFGFLCSSYKPCKIHKAKQK